MSLVKMCSSRVPLIIILGATGTGKTKLSLEFAEKFKTEIISADSMQLYKGLDIVSAKATPHERSLVAHHIIDILHPYQTCTVVDFRNRALNIINRMLGQNKIPIVVGGTNYYIESILWKVLIEDADLSTTNLLSESDADRKKTLRKKLKIDTQSTSETTANVAEMSPTTSVAENVEGKKDTNELSDVRSTSESESLSEENDDDQYYGDDCKLSNEVLYAKLKEVDPERAHALHPNNRRRILRSLQVWQIGGRKHSEVLKEQAMQEGGCGVGGPLRFNNAIIFWLWCQQDVHNERLDSRVDSMMEEGLVAELTEFHDKYNKQRIIDGQSADYTKGVFQSIGLKEFHDFLMLNEDDRKTKVGEKLFKTSLENLRIATKRYARYQNKTIKNRFLGHPGRQVPPIYKLDTTDISKWNENVLEKALDIVTHYQNGTESSNKPEPFAINPSYDDGNSPKNSHFCENCQRIIVGDMEYKIHMQSKKHRKVLKKLSKEKKLQESSQANATEPKHVTGEGSSL